MEKTMPQRMEKITRKMVKKTMTNGEKKKALGEKNPKLKGVLNRTGSISSTATTHQAIFWCTMAPYSLHGRHIRDWRRHLRNTSLERNTLDRSTMDSTWRVDHLHRGQAYLGDDQRRQRGHRESRVQSGDQASQWDQTAQAKIRSSIQRNSQRKYTMASQKKAFFSYRDTNPSLPRRCLALAQVAGRVGDVSTLNSL